MVALLALLAGCGGGGGGGAAGSPPDAPPKAGGSQNAPFVIKIPSGSTTSAKPKIISANTASVVLSVLTVNGAPPVSPTPSPETIVIATDPRCSTSGGVTTCNITFNVPIASAVVIQVATFDASGKELNVGTLTLDTTKPITTPQPLTLGVFPSSASVPQPSLTFANTGASTPVQTNLALSLFNNGSLISGTSVTYGGTVTVTPTNVPPGVVTVTPSSFGQPDGTNGASNTVAVSYTSSKGSLPSNASIVVAYNGTVLATLPIATLNYTPSAFSNLIVGGTNGTITVSEAYNSGQIIATTSHAYVTVSCQTSCAPTSPGGSVTFNVTPAIAGSGTITLTDANGVTASIPFSVSSTSSGGPIVAAQAIDEFLTTDSIGRNYGITIGPDGQTLWFVDQGGAEIGQVASPAACTTSCSIFERAQPSPPPAKQQMQFIASGQDGNLYVTDAGDGSSDVGSVIKETCYVTDGTTCSGAVNEPLPGSTPLPGQIINTPNGLFVASNFTNSLTAATIDQAQVPNCCSFSTRQAAATNAVTGPGIFGLALDSDGQTIWYTDTYHGYVGFLSGSTSTEEPANVSFAPAVRRRSVSTPAVAPPHRRPHSGLNVGQPFATPLNGIVEGHDGYLYLAEAGANQIDRLQASVWRSCSGATCLYTPLVMPNPTAVPMNLVNGPDGNVWFTDTQGFVGVILLNTCTSAGCTVKEYATGGAPWGITVGPDGDIWFTDSASNRIGKVVLQ